MLKTSVGSQIRTKAIKNLLSAHERIANEGSATEVIRFSKYLLKTADKFNDILVDVCPECKEQGSEDPI